MNILKDTTRTYLVKKFDEPSHVVGGGREQVLRVGREGHVPDPTLIFCAELLSGKKEIF